MPAYKPGDVLRKGIKKVRVIRHVGYGEYRVKNIGLIYFSYTFAYRRHVINPGEEANMNGRTLNTYRREPSYITIRTVFNSLT